MKKISRLFGNVDLSWKKLITFAIIIAIYTAIMAIIPITSNTSFKDIAIQFDCWIVFAIIIIINSKSPMDSALKCFVFFLISQPLIYLIQVPFSDMGIGIFVYYRYWFIWTLCTLPLGYIGYYIKKNNYISLIILVPTLLFLTFMGLEYLGEAFDRFPYHLLSSVFCFASIIILVLNIFKKSNLRIISLSIVLLFTLLYTLYRGGLFNNEYEIYQNLDKYNITINNNSYISSFVAEGQGNIELIHPNENDYVLKIKGKKKNNYRFSIKSDDIEYTFRYYYDYQKHDVVVELENEVAE